MTSLTNFVFIYLAVLITVLYIYVIESKSKISKGVIRAYVFSFIVLCSLFFGFRDVGVGTDTIRYVQNFKAINVQENIFFEISKFGVDFGIYFLGYIIKLLSSNSSIYLFSISLLFLSAYTIANYKLLDEKKYLVILFIVSFFFFYQMGVNVLKSSIAISFCILSLTYKDYSQYIFLLLALIFHFTSILFICAWFLVNNLENLKIYIGIWIGTLILSFLGIGITDILEISGIDFLMVLINYGELTNYISGDDLGYNVGFRYDFLLFSVVFLFFPYIYLKKYKDVQYEQILKMYLILNSFFLLSFYVPFSDRVGLFSWALLPVLVSKPLIQIKHFQKMVFFVSLIIFIISSIVILS